MNIREAQLGMNPSTASHRLVKDILFSLVKDTPCFHCGGKLDRETFSIEHKVPWLHSEDPVKMFFDLGNISFSHGGCNSSNKRHPRQKYFSEDKRKAGASLKMKEWKRKNYSPEARAKKYAEKRN